MTRSPSLYRKCQHAEPYRQFPNHSTAQTAHPSTASCHPILLAAPAQPIVAFSARTRIHLLLTDNRFPLIITVPIKVVRDSSCDNARLSARSHAPWAARLFDSSCALFDCDGAKGVGLVEFPHCGFPTLSISWGFSSPASHLLLLLASRWCLCSRCAAFLRGEKT